MSARVKVEKIDKILFYKKHEELFRNQGVRGVKEKIKALGVKELGYSPNYVSTDMIGNIVSTVKEYTGSDELKNEVAKKLLSDGECGLQHEDGTATLFQLSSIEEIYGKGK